LRPDFYFMGILYLVSTPIGNLEDITIRAIKILTQVKYVACEDTRRAGYLINEIFQRYSNFTVENKLQDTSPTFIRFDDHTEFSKLPQLIDILKSDTNIALISDAGTPLISDPGYKLVTECLKRKISVVSIPGVSAVLTALTSSGLPANHFTFLGYPPEKESHTLMLLKNIQESAKYVPYVYIFYCSPIKINRLLNNLSTVFGDISITITRELTKIHEEIWRGNISQISNNNHNFKGELVILFSLIK
jgi:16S rRNA (cytidine1402-2'-O)-methyltransferase